MNNCGQRMVIFFGIKKISLELKCGFIILNCSKFTVNFADDSGNYDKSHGIGRDVEFKRKKKIFR